MNYDFILRMARQNTEIAWFLRPVTFRALDRFGFPEGGNHEIPFTEAKFKELHKKYPWIPVSSAQHFCEYYVADLRARGFTIYNLTQN